LPAAVWLNNVEIVPSGVNHSQFPVFFTRNVECDLLCYEDRRDLRAFLTGLFANAAIAASHVGS
jgi:hypothetical protein